MKTMFVLFAVAAAACGGQSAAREYASSEIECAYTMPAGSSADDVQKVIDLVSQGQFDPCTGEASTNSSWQSAELEGEDIDEGGAQVVLRYKLHDYRRPNTP